MESPPSSHCSPTCRPLWMCLSKQVHRWWVLMKPRRTESGLVRGRQTSRLKPVLLGTKRKRKAGKEAAVEPMRRRYFARMTPGWVCWLLTLSPGVQLPRMHQISQVDGQVHENKTETALIRRVSPFVVTLAVRHRLVLETVKARGVVKGGYRRHSAMNHSQMSKDRHRHPCKTQRHPRLVLLRPELSHTRATTI